MKKTNGQWDRTKGKHSFSNKLNMEPACHLPSSIRDPLSIRSAPCHFHHCLFEECVDCQIVGSKTNCLQPAVYRRNNVISWSQAAGDPNSPVGNAVLAHEFFHQGQFAFGQVAYTSEKELEAAADSVRDAFYEWATTDPNTGQKLRPADQKTCSP